MDSDTEYTQHSGAQKGLDVDLVLELTRFLETVDSIDLSAVEAARRKNITSMERLVEDVKLGKKISRTLKKKKGPGRPRVHWRKRKAKQQARLRAYYQDVTVAKRSKEIAERLTTSEGWYAHCTSSWKKNKLPSWLSEEEWNEYIWPLLNGRVPTFRRIDKKKGFTVDNIVVYDSDTRDIIFDADILKLQRLGYVL